jgi:glycosyltransferase involved in cell wall biosynthesis
MRTSAIESPTTSPKPARSTGSEPAHARSSGSSDGAAARPLVSVIVPVWNGERFLAEAVESVRAQTYADWELLLIDDGSTDGSAAICRRYAALDPARIRFLQHPGGVNRGRCRTRNLGIASSRGDLVAFLDADDVYLPEKLERQVARLRDVPTAALTYGPSTHWFGWTGSAADAKRDWLRRLGVDADQLFPPGTLPRRWVRRRGHTPGISGALVRRAAVLDVGGFDETFTDLFADQAFFYKIALRYPVYVEGRSYDLYRQHADSTCSIDRAARSRAGQHASNPHYLAFLAWCESYVRSERVRDRAFRRALRVERFLQRHRRLARLARETRKLMRSWVRRARAALPADVAPSRGRTLP